MTTNNNWKHDEDSYVITEQGDLGLGITKIDPKYIDENGNVCIPKDDKEDEGFKRIVK